MGTSLKKSKALILFQGTVKPSGGKKSFFIERSELLSHQNLCPPIFHVKVYSPFVGYKQKWEWSVQYRNQVHFTRQKYTRLTTLLVTAGCHRREDSGESKGAWKVFLLLTQTESGCFQSCKCQYLYFAAVMISKRNTFLFSFPNEHGLQPYEDTLLKITPYILFPEISCFSKISTLHMLHVFIFNSKGLDLHLKSFLGFPFSHVDGILWHFNKVLSNHLLGWTQEIFCCLSAWLNI